MLLSDERLTRQAIGGDERAFTAIFERYQEALYRYCLAILGDREDAEDALQSTMVKVLRALPGEDRQIELKPWLYRIAHNESIELIRRRRPAERLDPELVAPDTGLAEEAVQRQRLRQLLADLDQLPERQRGALVMRELGGLGFEEIGAAFGTSGAVARQTLYEARLGLREMDAGREMSCDAVTRAISDADGRTLRRRSIRAHLRCCDSCQRFREAIESRERDLAALSPLPAVGVAAMLQGILGAGAGGSGAGAGGAGAALGAGAAKTVGASALLKGVATVAAVAAIGVTAADRGGLVHLGLPNDGGSRSHASRVGAGGAGAQAGVSRAGESPVSPAALRAARDGGGEVVSSRRVAARARAGAPPNPTNFRAGGKSSEEPQPATSSHGKSTAAARKARDHGPGANAKHAHPVKPVHPTKPEHPAGAAKPAHPTRPAHPIHPAHPSQPAASTSLPPAAEEGGAAPNPAKPESAGGGEKP